MTMRAWAIKPQELRPLTRAQLVMLAARCAARLEPCLAAMWPDAARTVRARWSDGLDHVVAAANLPPTRTGIRTRARALLDTGAQAERVLTRRDETDAECVNQMMNALAAAVEATGAAARPALIRAVIDTAKHGASIAALLAHAGRVPRPTRGGGDAVEHACTVAWSAVRADVAWLIRGRVPDERLTLIAFGALWPGRVPAWWPTPGRSARRARAGA